MNKVTVEQFIQKYTLGGLFPSVTWEVTEEDGKTKTATSAISKDRDAFASVSTNLIELDEGEYPIVETSQLRSLLNVLGDNIDVEIQKTQNDDPLSFDITDGMSKVRFFLSDPASIPASANLTTIPNFELEVTLDKFAIERFLRAKTALSEVRTFTLMTNDDDETKMVLGYDSSLNTNRVSMTVKTNGHVLADPISFSADYFKEMLVANKEATSVTLKISEKGLSKVEFDLDNFDVEYYLMKIKTASI